MALSKSILKTSLQTFCDEGSVNFVSFPGSFGEAATMWANAFDTYAKMVTPMSSTSQAAKTAFRQQFVLSQDAQDISFLVSCFTKYVQVLATGMAPIFIATPPLKSALNLRVLEDLGLNGASTFECVNTLTTLIDTWMRTGVAVNSVTGVTTLWV